MNKNQINWMLAFGYSAGVCAAVWLHWDAEDAAVTVLVAWCLVALRWSFDAEAQS